MKAAAIFYLAWMLSVRLLLSADLNLEAIPLPLCASMDNQLKHIVKASLSLAALIM
jgi:hypothetical protein